MDEPRPGRIERSASDGFGEGGWALRLGLVRRRRLFAERWPRRALALRSDDPALLETVLGRVFAIRRGG